MSTTIFGSADETGELEAELRVGILGVGNIGTVHLQSAAAMDGVSLVAAADTIGANRSRAARLGVEHTYEDYADLLNGESLDAVIVALPPFLHGEAVVAAAEAGCDVFVEKPFARTVEEGRAMLDAADEAGVSVGVDHTIRYQPEVEWLKERYDAGRIGHVPLSSIARINNGPFAAPPADGSVSSWQLDPNAVGGGALMDLGIHLLDVLEWFFGDLTVEYAHLDAQLGLPYEDTALLVLDTEAGTKATLSAGFFQWEEPPDVTGYFRLEGVADSLTSDDYLPERFASYAAKAALENLSRRVRGEEPAYFKPTYYYRAHYRALADFVTAIRADETPPVDGETGLRMVEHVESAYRMAETGPVPTDAPVPTNESNVEVADD